MSRNAISAAAIALVALVWLPAGNALASTKRMPDVTTLFPQALHRVEHADHGRFSHSVVLEAEGVTRGGRCSLQACTDGHPAANAAGVVEWRFVLQNETPNSPDKSAVLVYGPWPKRFGGVVGNPAPVLEDVPIHKAPKMTLAKAVSRLRHAGHHARFVDVTLRRPLGPKRVNPIYIFGFANKPFVGVDTVTGKVRTIH